MDIKKPEQRTISRSAPRPTLSSVGHGQPVQAAAYHSQPDVPASAKRAVKSIQIRIDLPASLSSLSFTPFKKRTLRLKKTHKVLLAAGGLAIAGFAIYAIASPSLRPTATEHTPLVTNPGLPSGTPDYPTVSPVGKDIKALGGWKRISPKSSNPVFAYADSIGSTAISVSQQPLPDTFRNEPNKKVTELAGGFGANEKIQAGSTTVHIGTASNNAQSVIFHKDNLLILIKSTQKLKSTKWVEYVNSLQ